ncbi:hypothetical protein [Kitasatospora sp. NPDC088783]|uniref:hypothetical protein n=1 Tax=Kitasatospora sp. NPDC088783 TaxID=3364077 RepID=UPI00380A9B9B
MSTAVSVDFDTVSALTALLEALHPGDASPLSPQAAPGARRALTALIAAQEDRPPHELTWAEMSADDLHALVEELHRDGRTPLTWRSPAAAHRAFDDLLEAHRKARPTAPAHPLPQGGNRRSPAVFAIDPPECGCTDCGNGTSVPLNAATDAQVAQLLLGHLANNTSQQFLVRVTTTLPDSDDATFATVAETRIEATTAHTGWERAWDLTAHLHVSQSFVLTRRV